ncbi:MAG: hypothetical protein JXM71_08490 [Spirochaetales bacterium]|nr:hypothetical protein [Spirochaetales bacterium]
MFNASLTIFELSAIVLGFVSLGTLLRYSLYDAAIIAAAVEFTIIAALFRPGRLKGWIPALIVSAVWILLSGDVYRGYNVFKIKIFGVSAFPMIAWPTALAFSYAYLVPLFRQRPWLKQWLVLSASYSGGLILAEWVGYNVFGIHLDSGRAYHGWPLLNIFHCPWWMQVAYFTNGISFMGMAAWMDRKPAPIRPAAWLRSRMAHSEASEPVPDAKTP